MSAHPDESLLNDWVDGLLDANAAAAIDRHLAGCAVCRRDAERLREVLSSLASLRRPVPPPHDLRPDIRRRLGLAPAATSAGSSLRRLRGLTGPALAAAAIVALFVVTLLSLPVREKAASVVASPADSVLLVELRGAEARYARAAAELAAALEAERERLDPATAALIEENLRTIERAIGESRAALAEQPGNVLLRRLVVRAYENKLDFLRSAAEAPTRS